MTLSYITEVSNTVVAIGTLLILAANIWYIRKFGESVRIQSNSSQGQLLLQLNRDFFYCEPHKKIIRRLEESKKVRGDGVSDEDLDDHIGFLDTLGTLVRQGILDKKLVWACFSHYVESAYENDELADYVREIQQTDRTIFEDFVWLYAEMKPVSVQRAKP